MESVSLQDLEDQGLLTWEQAEELAAHYRASDDPDLPEPLSVALMQAWLLATMEADSPVH